MVSVGDVITATFRMNLGVGLIGPFEYSYRIPSTARYIPNTFEWNGSPIPDSDPRLTITQSAVKFTQPNVPGELTVYELQLRTTGSIGQAVHHQAVLGGSIPIRTLRAPPTRIEDHTATIIIPVAKADASISEIDPSWNFGVSSSIVAARGAGTNGNALVRFDLSTLASAIPGGWKVQAAYLELYPQQIQGEGNLQAKPIKMDWVEGFMDAAPCFGGVTWTTTNCVNGWKSGGDLDKDFDEIYIDNTTAYIEMDFTSYLQDWLIDKKPEYGVALKLASGDGTVRFASREGADDSNLAPRLVVIAAPSGNYTALAARSVAAEIIPVEVIAGIGSTRFEYWLDPDIRFGETGINRFTISIPPEFQLVSVDSLVIGGSAYKLGDGTGLDLYEYENWGNSTRIDLRFSPTMSWFWDPPIRVILHAAPPAAPTGDKEFPSTFDNDRRGQPIANAQEGDAHAAGGPGDNDRWRVSALATELVRIDVTPTDTLVAVGYNVAYQAIAVYEDSTHINVTSFATWNVAPPVLGNFDSLGVLSAQQTGSGFVSATWNVVSSNSAALQIDPAKLVSLYVTPGSQSIAVGGGAIFQATGIYSSGDSLDMTASATWSVDDTTVARYSSPGSLDALSPGNTIVHAALSGFVAHADLTVTPRELWHIDISPADTTVALGFDVQLMAIGIYSDSTSGDLTSVVEWSNLPAGIIDIGVNGLTTTLAEGSAAITASLNDIVSASANFTVTEPIVVSLNGAPDSATVTVLGFHSVQSSATYSNGNSIDKTSFVSWQSLDPAVANFVGQGTVAALLPGTARLTHTLGPVEGDTLLVTVTNATLDSVVVEPRSLALPQGVDYSVVATGYWSDGSDQDVTSQSAWSSNNLGVASVDSSGSITALADGTAMISALFGGSTGACSLTVSTDFDSLVILPANTSIPVGISQPQTALIYRNGASLDVTHSTLWSTADTLIAVVDPSGTVTGRSIGATTLHAALGALIANPTTIQVTAAVVTSVAVQPASTTLRLGTGKQLTAIATYSDAQIVEVTAAAQWASLEPTIVYMQQNGVALGLSLGTAGVTATWDAVVSPPSQLQVLPSVRLEALPIGNLTTTPGTRNALLLSLRLTNHDVQVHQLSALRVDVTGPTDSLRLWLDNGDGVFDPLTDQLVKKGIATNGRWTANGINATVPVAGWRTVCLSADVSLTKSPHGATINAFIAGDADLFWDVPTATVSPAGFPLDSFGVVTAQNMVLSQMRFYPQAADTVFPGAAEVPLLQFDVPDNGGVGDLLSSITVQQIGSAAAGSDVGNIRLQTRRISGTPTLPGSIPKAGSSPPTSADPWQDVATLVHTGAGQWVASGLSVNVPNNVTTQTRLVGSIATSAREGRTVRLRLPSPAMAFSSGRSGPVDSDWTNPDAMLIEAQHQLIVNQTIVVPPVNPISRQAAPQVVLGLELTAWAASDDALTQLTLSHISTGPRGPASDVDAQIISAHLWLDGDNNGQINLPNDTELASSAPGALVAGEIEFGTATPLNVALPATQQVNLLVSLKLNPSLVRDAEFLRVQLSSAADLQTEGALEVILPAALQTLAPPQVDGQEKVGYDVRSLEGTILLANTINTLVMDLAIPADGIDDDVLHALRIENLGDATASDITRICLWQDDGNDTLDTADSLVVIFSSAGIRAWSATGLGLPLVQADPRRYWISVDVTANPVSGRTFQLSIPLNGIEVDSGNDGPIDAPLVGGGANLISVQNRVTWLDGPATSASVAPDATDQAILGLQAFNGYNSIRTLKSLDIAVRGTANPQEFNLWRLHSDENGNGIVDDADTDLAIASIANGRVLFSGFQWDMQPQLQQRLLVSYSLNLATARDASQIDAVIESEDAFGYVQGTQSIGSFELDSPGINTIDGMIRAQVGNRSVAQRSLGGGENSVLTLDLLLPSNGWQVDTLGALQVQLSPTFPAAVYGIDILDVELWKESDASPQSAQFNPAQDIYLQRAVQSGGSLLFSNIDALVPVGGKRFYVTVDVAASPTDSARVQLIVPANGIAMRSGNDGPLDGSILDTAVHTISSSDLLTSIDVQPSLASVGQQVSVAIAIRNQGSVQLDSVFVDQLAIDPPAAAALVSGPTPSFLSLPPQAQDTINYVFNMTAAGEVRFTAIARELTGPRQSDTAVSPAVHVEQPPSGLSLSPLSSLPPSVNRGQISVTPLIWQLSHPDNGPTAADIRIDTVQLHVQGSNGAPQLASAVFDKLEIRTGGLVHASWNSIPADTLLVVPLDIPVFLTAGEQRDLPLTVTIAADASASGFQIHLEGSGAIGAEDANSGQPVTLVATLPWSTQSASILTPATSIEVLTSEGLPAAINQGQLNVPGGSLTFVLPGAPGESEARVTKLTLRFEDAGQPVLAEDLFSRVRVRDGATTLLDLQDIQSESQELTLPLSIPKVIVSGDSVQIDLLFDLLNVVDATQIEVVVADPSAIEVRDGNSGAAVAVVLSGGGSFPWKQGPANVQLAAGMLDVSTIVTAPTGTFPGAPQMQILDLIFANLDPPGSANMLLESLVFEVLEEIGNPLIPTAVVTTARWYTDGNLAATTSVANGMQMQLTPASPFVLAPGDSVQVCLEVDLVAGLTEPWIRFHLPSNAVSARDGNAATPTITVLGMPASTALIQVVAAASAVGLGALEDPPANVVPGTTASSFLPVRIEHPGSANEADIQPQSLVVRLLDTMAQPLQTTAVATAASVVWDSLTIAASPQADSLVFDLSSLPTIVAGSFLDLQVQMDMATSIGVSDFRVALAADALVATSGSGQPLTVQAVGELGLPYRSPTVHVSAGSLEESFASYPNPFTPTQSLCNITFFLPADSRVTCDVYTVSGDRVTRLLNGVSLASGLHDNLTWDGRNERGDVVRNGTYLLRIQVDGAGGGEFYRKLAVIR